MSRWLEVNLERGIFQSAYDDLTNAFVSWKMLTVESFQMLNFSRLASSNVQI